MSWQVINMLQWCSRHWFSSWPCGAFKGAPTPRAARRYRPIPRLRTSVTRPGFAAQCSRACLSGGCPRSSPWTSCASWWAHQSARNHVVPHFPKKLLCFAYFWEQVQTVGHTWCLLSSPALLLIGAVVFVLHSEKGSVGLWAPGTGQRCWQVIIKKPIWGCCLVTFTLLHIYLKPDWSWFIDQVYFYQQNTPSLFICHFNGLKKKKIPSVGFRR